MSEKQRQAYETRKCPGCGQVKSFPTRNIVCGADCRAINGSSKTLLPDRSVAPPRSPLAVPPPSGMSDLEDQLLGLLKSQRSKHLTFEDACNQLDRGPAAVEVAIAGLAAKGHNIDLANKNRLLLQDEIIPEFGQVKHRVDSSHFGGNTYRFGVLGDTHLGSNHERLDALNAMYDIYEREGITDVYHTGNWIEGEMGKLNFHDIHIFGMDDQLQYFIENYPQRKGITTRYVAGDDHEGKYIQRERVDIGKYLELKAKDQGRMDLEYLGYVEADVALVHPDAPENAKILRIMHPGGGSAYALSYAAQKYVESLQGGEKPAIICYGHYHKYVCSYYREVYALGTGCMVDQSVFMRKLKLQAHVGGLILEVTQAPDGTLTRFRHEWFPFYNKNWYATGNRK